VDWLQLVAALLVILLGAQLFTNGVEWIGERYGLAQGVVGSVLAAIGTALPETLLPLIAIVAGGAVSGKEIGVGAIIGAPLMLSTLAMFVLAVALVGFARSRGRGTRMLADPRVIRQDLGFFVVMFAVGVAAGLIHSRQLDWAIAALLVCGYVLYVRRHVKAPAESEIESEASGFLEPLFLLRWFRRLGGRRTEPGGAPPTAASVGQTIVALALIIGGARVFVGAVEHLDHALQIPSLVFSLLIAPVATELPEQMNGVIWVGRRKDTLALGNVTGAMVFQASFPVTVGLLLTPWRLTHDALIAAIVSLVAAAWLYVAVRLVRTLPAWLLAVQVVLYAGYLAYVLTRL
jgi:cation:H+ antiporter